MGCVSRDELHTDLHIHFRTCTNITDQEKDVPDCIYQYVKYSKLVYIHMQISDGFIRRILRCTYVQYYQVLCRNILVCTVPGMNIPIVSVLCRYVSSRDVATIGVFPSHFSRVCGVACPSKRILRRAKPPRERGSFCSEGNCTVFLSSPLQL